MVVAGTAKGIRTVRPKNATSTVQVLTVEVGCGCGSCVTCRGYRTTKSCSIRVLVRSGEGASTGQEIASSGDTTAADITAGNTSADKVVTAHSGDDVSLRSSIRVRAGGLEVGVDKSAGESVTSSI